jgi:hypothetical protein
LIERLLTRRYDPPRANGILRIPQLVENPKLQKRIAAGEVDQAEARKREQACLTLLAEYDRGRGSLDAVVDALGASGSRSASSGSWRPTSASSASSSSW